MENLHGRQVAVNDEHGKMLFTNRVSDRVEISGNGRVEISMADLKKIVEILENEKSI